MSRGGYRPNAGRKKNIDKLPEQKINLLPQIETAKISDNLNSARIESEPESISFFRALMNDDSVDLRMRIEAAKSLLPYQARKLGETGKKEEREKKAKEAGSKFAKNQPPRLVKNG